MNFLDVHALQLLIAAAIATASFVVALSLVPVVRVAKVVRVVPLAPSRARRR